ncbi:hypothetical protein K488DRAFT_80127 [Vararia minispora EC-137]|uniref:Uncharacterized protein n=1 Tax=Vararia minispora EC-137 TaxID=1314806 RepID=A0ACB8QD42_9AGAM|nr:hypothetical protein K488DRAFT_80127 [Vararia minispora EC-137]
MRLLGRSKVMRTQGRMQAYARVDIYIYTLAAHAHGRARACLLRLALALSYLVFNYSLDQAAHSVSALTYRRLATPTRAMAPEISLASLPVIRVAGYVDSTARPFSAPRCCSSSGQRRDTWPSGLLLLASVLYAALGQSCESLWDIDPSIGPFLWSGLPLLSLLIMRRVNWVSRACHFVPFIRSAHGVSNFWIRSDIVSNEARADALRKTSSLLHCVIYGPLQEPIDEGLWRLTSAGLVSPAPFLPSPPSLKPAEIDHPTAHDFLLFAAIDYHAFSGAVVFSTKGMPASSVVDIDSEEAALPVVAAQMVRRPHSQSLLRACAKLEGPTEQGPYRLDLEDVKFDVPVCNIDFHSYSPESSKVSASLHELASAYLRVVRHVKQRAEAPNWLVTNQLARISVGQTMWTVILGGALLDSGRLIFQNLPGRWAVKDSSADEAFLTRVEAMLQAIEPYANTQKFFDLVFSGGTSRRWTHPFLVAGLCGQMIICYFLSVGTSAGVWTSVALSNSLYVGKLSDWHSVFFGRTAEGYEPGMKTYVPDSPSKEIMAIATFDRSPPRRGMLRPGFLLNTLGLSAAIFGAIFQEQTRTSLGFGPLSPTPNWVVYTAIALSTGTSLLIFVFIILQQRTERTWFDDSITPTRLWPVLDTLAWVSGFPLGVLENGGMISIDDNLLHLVLLNSSAGSSAVNGGGICSLS